MSFSERLSAVEKRIEAACKRAQRDPATVQLIAVSKGYDPAAIQEAAANGLTIFGESRIQEAAAKIPLCSSRLTWHLIGHLQGNKVRKAVELFSLIHSVDSPALLQDIQRAADSAGKNVFVLLEINVSGESTKFGIKPADLPAVIQVARKCTRVDVIGLMTMPPWTEDPEKARPYFRQLRELRDRCGREWDFPIEELSMGMSHDFEIAIEEGATYIRVGTDLFGARNKE